MARPSKVEVLGFIGHGGNRNEARKSAELQIKNLSQGSWTPVIFEWLGDAVLLYRTAFGWEYSFIRRNHGPVKISNCCIMTGTGTFNEARQAATHALVQGAWQVGMAMAIFPDFLTDESERKDHLIYRKMQLNIHRLMSEGHTVDDALRLTFEGRHEIPEKAGVFGNRLARKVREHQVLTRDWVGELLAEGQPI